MYFYQRLRDLREDADKTQSEIAAILNIAREQYQRYEAGKQELPMHHFIKLARFYNVSLDYLSGITTTLTPLSTKNKTPQPLPSNPPRKLTISWSEKGLVIEEERKQK